ncbi:dienelactone hydrolase [Salinimonas marina]|uniref:Dienelactone hydrolase n=1 Tax=Salinimonas marina TaxID=2785918 RepID=A0A7S9DVN3_9ALTE|nr:acyl-CoA thioester hydrolase/BAAT C-terminal domain-containing protein [Salinimonas marina]QPG04682.1 dienelactone hydrolase [Salinimonas marina]
MKPLNLARAAMLLAILVTCQPLAAPKPVSIDTQEFVANYYPGSDTAVKQVVMVLGGSEGGLPVKLAQAVADQGYPALALAYFKKEGLPEELENIPLEYFTKAKSWLMHNEQVNADQIVLLGWSKGAELALLLASTDSDFRHVVAIAPSSVVWAGILNDWQKVPGSSWTQGSKPLAHVPFNPNAPVTSLLDLYTQSLDNRADNGQADIPVENIKGKVFLYSGGQDKIWPSSRMASAICEKMQSNETSSCNHYDHKELDHLLDYKFLDPSHPLNKSFAQSLKGL